MRATDRCVTKSLYVARIGHPALDVRFQCDVYLVIGSDIRHPYMKVIGVAKGGSKMVVPDVLHCKVFVNN